MHLTGIYIEAWPAIGPLIVLIAARRWRNLQARHKGGYAHELATE